MKEFRVPRYTSYPTAPHFHTGVTAGTYVDWLETIATATPVSLYIHIPFCRKLCWFCGCHTKVVNHDAPVKQYLALLRQEITLVARHLPSVSVPHLHFGGGSPTILDPESFQQLMEHITALFSFKETEIAIEIDPRTVSEEKIATYAKAGITRASIGVQDFNPDVQQAVNRIQPYNRVYRCAQTLRDHGISHINLDLMYGLPYQTTYHLLDTVELALTLEPDRIALFGYAHVPWMKKHQRLIDEQALPQPEDRQRAQAAAYRLLVANDYHPVGIDHFAQTGDDLFIARQNRTLHRNFQGYTTDNADVLLGFGISAISSLPQGYVQNTRENRLYAETLGKRNLPVSRGIVLSEEDRTRREVILALMCYQEADLSSLRGQSPETLNRWQQEGCIEQKGAILRITEKGRPFTRVIASLFDVYLEQAEKRYSTAI